MKVGAWFCGVLMALVVMLAVAAVRWPSEPVLQPVVGEQAEEKFEAWPVSKFDDPEGAERLTPNCDVWVDPVQKQVILDGTVCMREGLLEMLACLPGDKEHESILSVKTQAYVVHAALLQVGAEAGAPAQFDPKYIPPHGTEIEIDLKWFDNDGNERTCRAQEWIRQVKTRQTMQHNWVFAGSGFWTDRKGRTHYLAEGGHLICVSNLDSALLDVATESPAINQTLVFDTFTEKIPPIGTPVRLVLKPKLAKKEASAESQKLTAVSGTQLLLTN